MAGLVRLFMRAHFRTPSDPNTSFEGKTILITGSNVGLGFEAAVKFVALNAAKVILAVRSTEKGETAKQVIEERTGKSNIVDVWEMDMSSYESIRKFADRATKTLDRIDIAILNAGIRNVSFEQSSYGWEDTLQINTLSTTLLAILLWPKLKASQSSSWVPVLEIVSSGLHQLAIISPEHEAAENILASYNTQKGFKSQQAYKFSKLFVGFAALQLASLSTRSDGKPEVVVTSVSPGACKSRLGRTYTNGNLMANLLLYIFSALFFRTTELGARSLVSGTTLGRQSQGKFWQDDELKPAVPQYSQGEKDMLQNRLWFEIVNALRKDIPEILELIKNIRSTEQYRIAIDSAPGAAIVRVAH